MLVTVVSIHVGVQDRPMSGRGHHLPTMAPARGCAIRCAGADGVRYPPLSMSDPSIPEETRPLSAIPSVGTRVAAFVAILVAGVCRANFVRRIVHGRTVANRRIAGDFAGAHHNLKLSLFLLMLLLMQIICMNFL